MDPTQPPPIPATGPAKLATRLIILVTGLALLVLAGGFVGVAAVILQRAASNPPGFYFHDFPPEALAILTAVFAAVAFLAGLVVVSIALISLLRQLKA